jgi:polysaccharide biosynthesis/export protein
VQTYQLLKNSSFEHNHALIMRNTKLARNCFIWYGPVFLFLILIFSSCANIRELTYLQGSFDTAKLSQVNAVEPIIRKGDLLSIIVYSDNPDATKIYNQSLIATSGAANSLSSVVTTSTVGGNSPSSAGYQVDENGNIVFQGLGLLHVEGLTKAALKDTLDGRLKQYLTNPYYNIRFLNYKFTMLGEIGRPGVISIPGERINLLEAIALAGDMTFYGRRDNIMVIRETNNKRDFARLDITKPEILASPYFYLQQNDVVIVEANKRKAAALDQLTYIRISIATSIVSLFAILYGIFR